MQPNKIEEIIQAKQRASETSGKENRPEQRSEETKFYSILVTEESCLELRFKNGTRAFFKYRDLTWGNWMTDGHLDLEFGGFSVNIKGRGLYPTLMQGIKNERVSWIQEADSPMEDNHSNEAFVESITITVPSGFSEEPLDDARAVQILRMMPPYTLSSAEKNYRELAKSEPSDELNEAIEYLREQFAK